MTRVVLLGFKGEQGLQGRQIPGSSSNPMLAVSENPALLREFSNIGLTRQHLSEEAERR